MAQSYFRTIKLKKTRHSLLVLPLLALLAIFVGKGLALKCYSCFSYDSETACEQDLWLQSCNSRHHDACTKFRANLTFTFGSKLINRPLTGYGRTCGRLQQCVEQSCVNFWDKDINLNHLVLIRGCKVECCQGDGCHTSRPPTNVIRNNREEENVFVNNVTTTPQTSVSKKYRKNNGRKLSVSLMRLYLILCFTILLLI